MSGEWQKAEQLTVRDLQHVLQIGYRNVSSPKLRQAANLIAMTSAAQVRENASKLASVLSGLIRHIEVPSELSAFEVFMLAMFAYRHANDVPGLKMPSWVESVLHAQNPKFEDWSFSTAIRVTHSHSMLTQYDEYCIKGKIFTKAMPDVCKSMRTLVTAQRFRCAEVLQMLTDHKMYLTSWQDLGTFGSLWEAGHKGKPNELYPGRRLWPNGVLSVGSSGETKRCSIGEVCTTMKTEKFSEAQYLKATAAKKRLMLENIPGVGPLNQSHLSRVLDHATGCGLAGTESLGSNASLALSAIGHSITDVRVRLLPHLRKMRICRHVSLEELQMDLCTVVYAVQTYITGTNRHHPRLSLESSIQATTVPLQKAPAKKHAVPRRQEKSKSHLIGGCATKKTKQLMVTKHVIKR